MNRLVKRLEAIERQIGSRLIPDKDRIIVIPYPAGDEDIFDQLCCQRLAELRDKYGDVSENDLLFIGVKKFARVQ